MSLWKIAWRSIRQRGIASLLTAISMALGVMLLVAVLTIHGVVAESFQNNTTLGYNMIVGANKGGKLQLTLNTVFYLSEPVENIPYDYYLEFVDREERDRAYEHSIQRRAHDATWDAMQSASLLLPMSSLASGVQETIRESDGRTARMIELFDRDVAGLDRGRDGQFSAYIDMVIPVCLGDYLGPFRVVGTTPEMFDRLQFGESGDRPYEFARGRNFRTYTEEHGYFEAVLGATVAREMQLDVGDAFAPTHGDPAEGASAHGQKFQVVGVLAPTGTPNDRAAFINIEGFYLMEDHARPVTEEEKQRIGATPGTEPLAVEQREVTAILVRTINPIVTPGLENVINEGGDAQAVLPIGEIYRLFSDIVGPIQQVLFVLTVLICIVSGISILVSIYNSMNDRQQEIAVMRALGAGRGTVMAIILLESIMLALGGGLIGWVGGHALNGMAGGSIEARTGVSIGFFDFAPPINILEVLMRDPTMNLNVPTEVLIIPGLMLLAVLVGFLPALAAYRTDVASSLDK